MEPFGPMASNPPRPHSFLVPFSLLDGRPLAVHHRWWIVVCGVMVGHTSGVRVSLLFVCPAASAVSDDVRVPLSRAVRSSFYFALFVMGSTFDGGLLAVG